MSPHRFPKRRLFADRPAVCGTHPKKITVRDVVNRAIEPPTQRTVILMMQIVMCLPSDPTTIRCQIITIVQL